MTAPMQANPLLVLAHHAASLGERPLTAELEHHARRALVDWTANLLPGSCQPPATLLTAALASERGTGRAICYADGQEGGMRHAALINAVASHTIQFDDIHRDSGCHPGAPVIAAALAVAQSRRAGLDALLQAITAGYEVCCRIGMAVAPSHYRFWHPTGTLGTFGAATAAALLLGCDTTGMAHAIATAATMTGGLKQAMTGGGMSKPLHAGHAAEAGVLAALAAAAAVTGVLDVLDGPAGFAAATSANRGDWHSALQDLGKSFAIGSVTFKNYGCNGHIFTALDAIRDLQAEEGFRAEDVAQIHVASYASTKEICDRPQARSLTDARFSLQYCVAVLLLLGGVRASAFDEQHRSDPAVHALMAKITLSLAPDLAIAYPKGRPARVRVTLQDGRVLEHVRETRKGDPEDPLSDQELSDKFLELTRPVIGERAEALLELLWHGNDIPMEITIGAELDLC